MHLLSSAGRPLSVVALQPRVLPLQEFVVMASNILNDTLRLASIW